VKIKERAEKLKTDIPAIFIALKKKETPIIAKIFAALTVISALSPIDLIPDFIPVLGFIDDIIILPILIAITVKFIPNEIFIQCRIESENFWNSGKPKEWYYAIPIIMIWLILIYFLIIFIANYFN